MGRKSKQKLVAYWLIRIAQAVMIIGFMAAMALLFSLIPDA